MSDDELIKMLLILGGLSFLMLISGMMSTMAKQKNQNESNNCPPEKPPLSPIQEQAQLKKQQAEQKEESAKEKTVKCMFCGADIPESQVFCGTCGRRRD